MVGLTVAFIAEPYVKVVAVPASYLRPMVAQQRSMSLEQFAAETPSQTSPAESQFPQMPPVRKPPGWRD